MTRRLAIIPARGGSKRLPRKNLLPFGGQPIIVHTIAAALASARFERILVSTDDSDIAAIAKTAGAEIHRREEALATDDARVVDVCLDVLESEERARRSYDVFSCLYATAPLRTAEDIAAVVDLIDGTAVNFAMAVTAYPLPPHQALRMSNDNMLTPMWPDLVDRRASSLDPLVVDNGSTYAATVTAFRKHRTFYGPGLRGHLMPRKRSIDIDDQTDYALACWYADLKA
jgi:CMP-N-acetylneuraminic acid synthetase